MNNVEYDPWDDIQLSPEETIDSYKNRPEDEKDPWDNVEFSEGFWKNAFRTALQVPQGIAEGTQSGIATGLWHLLGQGAALDPEEIDHIKQISEREGIPFDEDSYMEAAQNALKYVPTVSNIAREIEEKIGLPLEPKTKIQKGLRLGSLAGKFQPGSASQKATAGIVAPAVSQGSQALGFPEPFAELAGLAAGAGSGAKTPPVDVKFGKTKPSGLPERGFEKLKEPTEVPAKKIQQINDKLEKDFRNISDKIIKDSPIGETAENLKNDPRFKRESKELLDQAQILADETPGTLPAMKYKESLLQQSQKQIKGFALNEYKKNYLKFMKEAVENVLPENVTYGELVEQYRENNRSLGEYFEPGASKALNRAKKDVLLDQNRAIASVLEENNPELSKIFKEGNERWSKIMDVETIDNFVSDMFPEGKKIDFKHMKGIFDDPNYQRILKRSLGEEGSKAFETAIEDMLTAERPYKMMREAQSKGLGDLMLTAKAYLLNPKIGYAKAGIDAVRFAYRSLFNATLDKPQIGLKFTKAVKELKTGNFSAAEKDFKAIQAEILPKEESTKVKSQSGTLEIIPEKIEPKEIAGKEEPKRLEHKKPEVKEDAKEAKRVEALKKFNEKKNEIQFNTSHKKTSYGGEIEIHDKEGKRIAGLDYSKNQEGIYIEDVFSYKPGGAKKAVKDFVEMFSDKDLFMTPMTEKGAKAFENELGIKIQPRIIKGESIQETLKRPREDYKLTESDKNKILGIKEKPSKSLSEEKVKEVKRQDISKKGLKEQKNWLLDKLDAAIEKAPNIDISMKRGKKESVKEYNEKHNKLKDLLTFDVPGDGEFKIKNHKSALETFKKAVEKKWPDKPMSKARIK